MNDAEDARLFQTIALASAKMPPKNAVLVHAAKERLTDAYRLYRETAQVTLKPPPSASILWGIWLSWCIVAGASFLVVAAIEKDPAQTIKVGLYVAVCSIPLAGLAISTEYFLSERNALVKVLAGMTIEWNTTDEETLAGYLDDPECAAIIDAIDCEDSLYPWARFYQLETSALNRLCGKLMKQASFRALSFAQQERALCLAWLSNT